MYGEYTAKSVPLPFTGAHRRSVVERLARDVLKEATTQPSEVTAMQYYRQLLENNRRWVERKNQEDPTFFAELAKGQRPPFLWIGCADSRVPANEITGTQAGEVFVHRNIANLVVNTDMSLLSVLDYAVNVLEVEHVIVCGHYGCGGVLGAMGNRPVGLVDNWLGHIKDVYRMHQRELESITDLEARGRRLVELNVLNGVHDLYANSIIQTAWRKRGGPHVHGWVYDIRNGLLRELESRFSQPQDLEPVYRMELDPPPATKTATGEVHSVGASGVNQV